MKHKDNSRVGYEKEYAKKGEKIFGKKKKGKDVNKVDKKKD